MYTHSTGTPQLDFDGDIYPFTSSSLHRLPNISLSSASIGMSYALL